MKFKEQDITYKSVMLFGDNDVPFACGDIEIFEGDIWLNHFAVAEELRGKGYGQLALQFFIEKYGVNTLSCAVTNEVAFHIYKKYGFEVVEDGYMFGEGKVYIMKRKSGG